MLSSNVERIVIFLNNNSYFVTHSHLSTTLMNVGYSFEEYGSNVQFHIALANLFRVANKSSNYRRAVPPDLHVQENVEMLML